MDNRQAKEILSAYRPGVDDADPQVTEALAQARHDPELARWLEEQTALDSAIREKLRSVAVPLGLKTRILANTRAESPAVAWWKRRPVWLAAAAVVLLVEFILYLPHLRPANAFTAYRAGMVEFVAAGYRMELHADNLDALRQHFVQDGWPADYVVPPGLAHVVVRGGCQSQWRGSKVSLLCLHEQGHNAWLFVIDRSAVWNAPLDKPIFMNEGRIATASWTAGHLAYVLATEGDEAELKSLL